MIVRKNENRIKNGSRSRKYVLGSFFNSIIKAITDPKDGKALGIKADPAYLTDTEWGSRKENKGTIYKSRFNS